MKNDTLVRGAIAAALIFTAAGCSGSKDDPPENCALTASYGALGAVAGVAAGDASGAIYRGDLGEGDFLSVELYDGFGVFSSGIAPGTYALTGDEIQYETCGACVLIAVDVVDGVFPTQSYLATGGTLTLDSVAGNLTGSLSNVTLRRVEIDDVTFRSTPVGSCTSSITSASFDATITAL